MPAGKTNEPRPPCRPGKGKKAATPGWAEGLRQLYDAVVVEPLPDSFRDLLARLNDESR